jgi:hypothetical protein
LGVIEAWLKSSTDGRIDRTVTLLFRMQRSEPDQVADLLEPHIGGGGPWPQRLRFIMQWAELGASRRFLELFLRLLDNGTLDEIRGPVAVNSDFWSLVYPVAARHPDWASQIIGHYFRRRLEISLAGGQANPFDRDRGTLQDAQLAGDIFRRAARGAPEDFVDEVLPFMLRVMDLTAERTSEPPWADPAWRYRFFGGGYGLAGQLLRAMETSLATLAELAPDKLRPILTRLVDVDFETAQYLALRTYAVGGHHLADEAVDYILARPRRLETGYLDSSRWAARQVIEGATPHCSADRLIRLEEILCFAKTSSHSIVSVRHPRATAARRIRGGRPASSDLSAGHVLSRRTRDG